jgi:YidC/Oxa1 family membrane protein insertase
MTNNKNVFLAIVLSALVIFGWQYFIATPQMKAEQARQAQLAKQEKKPQNASAAAPGAAPNIPGMSATNLHLSREAALKAGGPRVAIETPMLDGSILLKGGKIDDLRLRTYHETTDPQSPEIVLLAPKSTDYPYFAEFGWVGGPSSSNQPMPDDNSQWTQQGAGALSPGHPVTLSWDNGHGLIFTRTIAVDDKYMFTVTDQVKNSAGGPETLYPFAYVAREGTPKATGNLALHIGFVGIVDGSLKETKYSAFKDSGTPPQTFSSTGGWVGITDQYWMTAVVPPQGENFSGAFLGSDSGGAKAYQANYRLSARSLRPGATVSATHRLYAGAKVVDILRFYQDKQGIGHFDQAVDWGDWLWVFTRPIFWLLDTFYKWLGNFGLAILMLTVVVKLVFFPLANATARSSAKMKKVQPELERLKKQNADDPQKLQAAMMELYKREKINPLSMCLPMLIQIPVFFSLYKVLYVTIEMRQAPFFGWVHDLSAQDPTSILNLFGLLPYHIPAFVPAYLSIGIWPILYGMTQWVQTKLNPPAPDPVQAKMFAFMPLIFTFMFATFPVGLVIYYCWNNLLTIIQQWYIMHRMGVPVHLFENIRRKKAT